MKKWLIKILAVSMIVATMVGVRYDVEAQAKTRHIYSEFTDWRDNTFIDKDGKRLYGWFKIGKKTYYAHKTTSYSYPKGSICKNTYRVKKGKMYYFDENGVMVRKNTRRMPSVTFNKDGSVHYIYAHGLTRRYRYNANRKRYQYYTNKGKWVDVGSQCYPYGMIDWQE